jgi:hypothetical protein
MTQEMKNVSLSYTAQINIDYRIFSNNNNLIVLWFFRVLLNINIILPKRTKYRVSYGT